MCIRDSHIDAQFVPRKCLGVPLGQYGDGARVEDDRRAVHLDVAAEPAVGGVVAEEVGQRLGRGEVIDRHHIDIRAHRTGCTEIVPTDAPETVDADPYGHCLVPHSSVVRCGCPVGRCSEATTTTGTASTLGHPRRPGHQRARSESTEANLEGSWASPLGLTRSTSTTGIGQLPRGSPPVSHTTRSTSIPWANSAATCIPTSNPSDSGTWGRRLQT